MQRRFFSAAIRASVLPWLYLSIVGSAELLIALGNVQIGLGVHVVLLLALTLYAGLSLSADSRALALAITLAPLLRILSLALPLAHLPQLAWYPIISAPLLISALLVIRQLRMSRAELGLRPGNPLIQLMLIGGGLGVGAAEYALLGAPQLVVAFSWNALTLLAVLLLIFTGFVEELIFRGLLQAVALPVLGRWALVYLSLLFAALQIGYLSAPAVAFAFVVGLLFAYAARWSGSLVGVALAHGLANITLFILMPFLAQQASSPIAVAIRSAIAASTTLAVAAVAFLFGQAIWQWRRTRLAVLPTPQLPIHPVALPSTGVPDVVSPTRIDSVQPITPSQIHNQTPLPSQTATTIEPSRPLGQPAPNQKLFFGALLPWSASRPDAQPLAAPMIRTLRRAAGITYVELGQRTQLPARLLAEIEHGWSLPTQAQLGLIFEALGVDLQQAATM